MIDIYFSSKRLSISAEPTEGYEIAPRPEVGIKRSDLLELFERNRWVTLRVTNEAEEQDTFDMFASQFLYVVAAGGVVSRSDGRVLMIYRNRRWDLPKGHWEEGESIEECAIREVEEECGLCDITLGKELCQTIHSYFLRDKWEIKRTYWYSMQSDSTLPLTPQQEEGIERAEWLSAKEIDRAIERSFPTIKSVIAHSRM